MLNDDPAIVVKPTPVSQKIVNEPRKIVRLNSGPGVRPHELAFAILRHDRAARSTRWQRIPAPILTTCEPGHERPDQTGFGVVLPGQALGGLVGLLERGQGRQLILLGQPTQHLIDLRLVERVPHLTHALVVDAPTNRNSGRSTAEPRTPPPPDDGRLDGPNAGDIDTRIEVGSFAAIHLASLLGIEVDERDRTHREWAGLRSEVRSALRRELDKPK